MLSLKYSLYLKSVYFVSEFIQIFFIMSEKHDHKDRRRHRRLPVEIPVEIASISFQFKNMDSQSRVVNISCSGLYCQVNRFFPLFTKLNVTLLLKPTPEDNQNSGKITCRGVVVRTEPSHRVKGCREYRIAIFVPKGIPINSLSGVVIN